MDIASFDYPERSHTQVMQADIRDRCFGSQYLRVGALYLHLIDLLRWPNYSHITQAPMRTHQGHGLQRHKMMRLVWRSVRMKLVVITEQLLYDTRSQMHITA